MTQKEKQFLRAAIDTLPEESSGATQPPIGPFIHDGTRSYGPEDFRKLRIMKAMEDIAAKNPDALFTPRQGYWEYRTALGFYEVNDYYSPKDPEEQRIDKEIAEVKAEKYDRATHCVLGVEFDNFNNVLIGLEEKGPTHQKVQIPNWALERLQRAMKYHDEIVTRQRNTIADLREILNALGKDVEPPATDGAPATPESAAEKLWEDEIWVNPGSGQVRQQERGDCEKDYHYSGWRRIKVKEVR